MATLVDTFMEDCEDSDDDDLLIPNPQQQLNQQSQAPEEEEEEDATRVKQEADVFADMEELIDIDVCEHNAADDLMRVAGVESVSDLLHSARLQSHLDAIQKDKEEDDDDDDDLVEQSNVFVLEIENHILRVHKFIRDIYATKFPELEAMVVNATEYAKCVQLLGNASAEEMSALDLRRVLSNASVAMTVHVTATTTTGKRLQARDLRRVMAGADALLRLDEHKRSILEFVATRMHAIAPNVAALIGAQLTAKLIGVCGGVLALAAMPACNIQVLGKGAGRDNGHSHSSNSNAHQQQQHFGLIAHCELIRARCATPQLQARALRVVAAKLVLAARVDASRRRRRDASYGQQLYGECAQKIEKWHEAPPPKAPRPLSVPDTKPKKKRGGKRYRKMRERYKVTETQRIINRMAFNRAEEEIIDGNGEIVGLGMLRHAGDAGGRLRNIKAKSTQSTLHTLNHRQLVKQKRMRMRAERAGTVTGLTTSVVFTAVQGIELSNPDIAVNANNNNSNNSNKYFNHE